MVCMKDLLKLAGFAFLVVILLVASAPGEAKAQSRIKITPEKLDIRGVVGTSSFQYPFTIQAVDEDIAELTFSPGNLMEISEGKTWIVGADVLVTPQVNSVKKGHSQDFIVTVQNIPGSGQYEGNIAVGYKEQAAEAQDILLVSVRAAEFSVTPPQIVLRFEKSLLGLGGPAEIPWTLTLNAGSRWMPQEMITTLAETASSSLASLVRSEDSSQVILPEQIFIHPAAVEATSVGQGLTIETIFTNPQVKAGKYTGDLEVGSRDFGLLATVPLEVHVRYPSWLAVLLIVIGILTSLLVNYWNTTGKRKNDIKGKISDRQRRLEGTGVTEAYRRRLQGLLDKMWHLLEDNKLDEVEKEVKEFDEKLDAFTELLDSLAKLEDDLSRLEQSYQEAFTTYFLKPIKRDLKQIRDSKDVAELGSGIEADRKQVGEAYDVIREVKGLEQDIQKLADQGLDMGSARKELGQCKRWLTGGHVDVALAKKRLSAAKKAVDSAPTEYVKDVVGRSDSSRLPELDKALRIKNWEMRFDRMADILNSVITGEVEAEEERARFEAIEYTLRTSESLRPAAKVATVRTSREPPAEPGIRDYIGDIQDHIRRWWTPKLEKRVIDGVLFLVVIPVLGVIGFSQLYAGNHTFGAKNVWQEYLTLFLWGLGIQTSTATVAGVLKAFRGS